MKRCLLKGTMSQDTMKDLLTPVDEQAESKRLKEQARWANWGRDLGTATRDQILRNAKPDWQWDDYAI